jgi:hypothetical protein
MWALAQLSCLATCLQVRRVKAESRFGPGAGESGEIADGVTLEWDPADYDSNPEGRFPMGC